MRIAALPAVTLALPACDSAFDADFRVDSVRVGAADWYIRGFGMGTDADGMHLVLMEVADSAESGVPNEGPAPTSLPACRGVPEYQQGVPLTG